MKNFITTLRAYRLLNNVKDENGEIISRAGDVFIECFNNKNKFYNSNSNSELIVEEEYQITILELPNFEFNFEKLPDHDVCGDRLANLFYKELDEELKMVKERFDELDTIVNLI